MDTAKKADELIEKYGELASSVVEEILKGSREVVKMYEGHYEVNSDLSMQVDDYWDGVYKAVTNHKSLDEQVDNLWSNAYGKETITLSHPIFSEYEYVSFRSFRSEGAQTKDIKDKMKQLLVDGHIVKTGSVNHGARKGYEQFIFYKKI